MHPKPPGNTGSPCRRLDFTKHGTSLWIGKSLFYQRAGSIKVDALGLLLVHLTHSILGKLGILFSILQEGRNNLLLFLDGLLLLFGELLGNYCTGAEADSKN